MGKEGSWGDGAVQWRLLQARSAPLYGRGNGRAVRRRGRQGAAPHLIGATA